ncbi:MAG: bifunctional 4-hydroxy-3-methylbut-2-enyl diphosphate reductase/30S ribosomal protein S1 [Oscillospiraceae bacterium]|nr:bifunctional 4-hydroxy-3-methylbut-2-enyl diphosphate reductase/30S ribosomal protein S1 [Oscillospiraceae bacterium]
MKLELAQSAGFCYGVRRAIDMAEAAAQGGIPCVMLGHIIHNEHAIQALTAQGIAVVQTPDEIPPGYAVILRSHGEGKAVHDALSAQGLTVIDSTCPNVSHIHRLVQQADAEGHRVLIFGEAAHPEVQAIAGWCREPVIISDVQALAAWLDEVPERRDSPLVFVSQTTAAQEMWNTCAEKAKKECTNIKIFDTICQATCMRQTEAKQLAARCDAMIIIGGRESANTKRLYELCNALCPHVMWVTGAEQLQPSALRGKAMVGITAGASTPGWIIKEVYDKMSDEIMEIEESFAELLEKPIKTLNTGDKVVGVVTGISPTEVYVDLGTKYAGYIPLAELTDDPTAKVEDLVSVGSEIETYVTRVNDQEGVITLSKKRLDAVKNWDLVEQAQEDGTIMEGIVTEENKGGVVAQVKGVRVFIPASQTGLPRDTPMTPLIKKKVRLRIKEINRARRRVVGSISDVTKEERAVKAAEVWANIEEGKHYEGVVKSMTSYGAFVDVGGVDGMVHISEMSWSRIKTPAEIMKVGDVVDVYVISFDPEKKKISLGMKDRGEEPWKKFVATYGIGDTANVKVVKLMTFGAFAEIVPGVDGLIHISQIADHRIDKPGDVLAEGQMVDVKVTDIDFEHKKVSLSIRALIEESQRANADDESDSIVATSEAGATEVASAFSEAAEQERAAEAADMQESEAEGADTVE